MATSLHTIDNLIPLPGSVTEEHELNQSAETSTKDLKHNVLDLTRILHQTLEIDELIRVFEKQMKAFVPFDGLRYLCTDLNINIMVSREAHHCCNYKLQLQRRSLGEISFYRASPFTPAEMHELENMLCALFYPLQNAHQYTAAVRSAFIDPLTGAENRAALDSAMNREVELSRRQDSPLSVIMFDIDFFKRINDEYGHAEGDNALQSVVRCAKQTVRGSDLIFRYGGEEFLLLLSHTDLEGAALLAERIRANIEQSCTVTNRNLKLTVSLGVAQLESSEEGDSLIKRADQAMYQAKNNGRNRVVCIEEK